MNSHQLRHFSLAPVTVEGRRISGYAIVWGSESRDLGGFVERFLPGSVSESVNSGTLTAVAHHDDSQVLGTQEAGTLRLREDATGLAYEVDLPDTSYARDLAALMTPERRDVSGTSFSFMTPADRSGEQWTREAGKNVRTIRKATLGHISPVAVPAYPQTSAVLRSLALPETGNAADLYGFDLEQLAELFLAAHKGLRGLTTEQQETARRAIVALQSVVGTPRLKAAADKASTILI